MDASFSPGLYYRHSGKFSVGGVLVAIGLGLLVGLPCAWLYALLIRWNPFVYINILAGLGFGLVISLVIDSSLKSHKCRSVPIAGLAVLVSVLVSYYASWAVWLHLATQLPTTELLLHPLGMWKVILLVNDVGTWNLRGDVVKGIPLWIVWCGEAAIIIGFAVYIAVQSMQESTYCEGCDRLAVLTKGVCLSGAGAAPPIQEKAAVKSYRNGLKSQADELKQHLELKDIPYVEKLGGVQPDAIAWYEFDLASCPQCNMTNTLSLSQVQSTGQGKKGKEKITKRRVLHHLLLSSTEADSIRKLNEKLSCSAPPSVLQHPAGAS